MVRLTQLPGSVLTTKEASGSGKKLVLVALALAGLAVVLRRRRSSSALEAADESSSGIDQIRTDDDGADPDAAADDASAADDATADADADADAIDEAADDDVVEVTAETDEDTRVIAPLRLDTDASLDLFDLISIVGAAYKAARNEYEDRRAVEA